MNVGRRAAAYGGGGIVGAGVGMAGLLAVQARLARRWIGRSEGTPPNGEGLYLPHGDVEPLPRHLDEGPGATWSRRGRSEVIRLGLIGDSSAAGLGVERADQTPGALLASRTAATLGRPVSLRSRAVVGAQSADLDGQLDELLTEPVDLVVIMIGANDVTHRVAPADATALLEAAVARLRAAGAWVVTGTCPDLGTIRPIPHPLRLLCRHWSRRLSVLQAQAVARSGGVAVQLGQVLGPEFDANPHELFASDGFHPSASGYRAAVGVLLPAVLLGLGADDATAGAAGADLLVDFEPVTDADEDPVATRR